MLVLPDEEPTLELDELWSFVLKKANKAMDLDRSVQSDPASGRVRHRRPKPGKLGKFPQSDTVGEFKR